MIPMLAPWEGRYVIHPCISKLQFQFQILPFALQFLQWMHHYHRVTILVHWSPKAKDKRGDEITWCVVTSLGWCPGKTNSTWSHSHFICLQWEGPAVNGWVEIADITQAGSGPSGWGVITSPPSWQHWLHNHPANIITQHICKHLVKYFLAAQTFLKFLSGANTRERRGQVNSDLKTKI